MTATIVTKHLTHIAPMNTDPFDAPVLVVDSDAFMRHSTTELLKYGGYSKVLSCASAEEALECVKQDKADIVICELALPGMDGLALLRAIRGLPVRQATHFVLVTHALDRRPSWKSR